MKVLFFAQCADWMRRRELSVPVDGSARLLDVLERPEFAPLRARLQDIRVAVNQEHSDFKAEVRDGDEIALFPPVCGG